ncbi:MAG: hypothetical protein IM562_06010, partial [Chitinophagaceae bacterium]|nr:hypothetical protein [Chitinophagaceae bacterium]
MVGDGQTERIYFANVRDTDRPDNLAIFPDYPRKLGSYTGVLERAMQIIGEYDKVYALIDLDKIHQDNKYAEYQLTKKKVEEAGL